MRKFFIAFVFCTFVFIQPGAFVVAASQTPDQLLSGGGGGLVPDAGTDQAGGAYFRACDLVELSSNVLNFGVAFSVIVATLMFAYAGILYVTAASNPEQVKKAHKVFGNIFVGLLLVLLAWLIVNIFFSVLTGQGLEKWGHISCISNPTSGAFSGAPAASSISGGGSRPAGGVAAGGRCSPMQTGVCSPQNLTGYFGADASLMSSICHKESSGGNNLISGTDRLWSGGQSFSFGIFQYNLTQSRPLTCGGVTLQCSNAFNPPANPSECRQVSWGRACAGNGFGYTLKNDAQSIALYNTCKTAAMDTRCNLENARNLYQQRGTQPWLTSARACNLN